MKCKICGLDMKERNKVLECPNKCDRTTARGPVHNGLVNSDYEILGDGCFIKTTQYKE
jgi:hypothetical protein